MLLLHAHGGATEGSRALPVGNVGGLCPRRLSQWQGVAGGGTGLQGQGMSHSHGGSRSGLHRAGLQERVSGSQ